MLEYGGPRLNESGCSLPVCLRCIVMPQTTAFEEGVQGVFRLRSLRWRWILAVGQLLLAVALELYGDYQFTNRVAQFRAANPEEILDWGYLSEIYPTSAARAVYMINFPARLASGLVPRVTPTGWLGFDNPKFNNGELAFLAFVFILWYGLGRELEIRLCRQRPAKHKWPLWLTATIDICGFIISIGAAITVAILVVGEPRPWSSGVLGTVTSASAWTMFFIIYFAKRLRHLHREHRR